MITTVRPGSLAAVATLLPKAARKFRTNCEQDPVISRFKFCKRKRSTSVDSFERSLHAIGRADFFALCCLLWSKMSVCARTARIMNLDSDLLLLGQDTVCKHYQ